MKTQFIIPLRVASKKNNRRNFGRISLPSKAYEKFHSLVAQYLLPYRNLKITTPFELEITYRIKGKYKQDVDNVLSSVLDCMQDYGLIVDDNLCYRADIVKIGGNLNWYCAVTINY